MSRTRSAVALVVGVALSAGLVTGCGRGASGSTAPDSALLTMSADVATCEPGVEGRTCAVTVSYQNASTAVVELEPGATLLVDSFGDVHRGVSRPELAAPLPVAPGERVSIAWTTTIPADALVERVTYADGSGVAATVALRTVVSATPSTSPSPVVTPQPVAPATPKATPAPTAARPTPTPTRTRTRAPSPSPTSGGSIG